MARRTGGGSAGGWTEQDEYLWHTCDIVADVVAGQVGRRPRVPTTARLEPGERALATGPGERYTLRQVGGGGGRRRMGWRNFGLIGVAANAVGNAANTLAGGGQGQGDAGMKWVHGGSGELTVCEISAYLVHPQNPVNLGFTGLDVIDLPAPGAFEARYHDMYGKGYMSVRLHSPWASLVFALAALAAFPSHPRLLGGTWLPPGFEERCAQFGRPVRPAQRLVLGQE